MILDDFALVVLGHVDHGGHGALSFKRIGRLHFLNAEFFDHRGLGDFDVVDAVALVDVGHGADVLRSLSIQLGRPLFQFVQLLLEATCVIDR